MKKRKFDDGSLHFKVGEFFICNICKTSRQNDKLPSVIKENRYANVYKKSSVDHK